MATLRLTILVAVEVELLSQGTQMGTVTAEMELHLLSQDHRLPEAVVAVVQITQANRLAVLAEVEQAAQTLPHQELQV